MGIVEAFMQFELAVDEVLGSQGDPDKKKEMGRSFCAFLESTGDLKQTKHDIQDACGVSRATIDRWCAGTTVPHRSHRVSMKQYALGMPTLKPNSLAVSLLNPRYRPAIKFLLDEEAAGRNLSEEQLSRLLWLAEESKGEPTVEMIRTFLGLTS